MCGISGFISNKINNSAFMNSIALDMSNQLKHRGPDDNGIWINEINGIVLAHNRLSIIDLSIAGHQPMISNSKRFILSFNGEIYNHKDLRKELEFKSSINWKGTSDTETLIYCSEYWGIKATIKKILGMFAISLWDNVEKKLYLIRDRFGEKPLYYGFVNGSMVFASELKAIKKFPDFNNNISKEAVDKYLRLSYIPSPLSIYENIFKLDAGSILCLNLSKNEYNRNNIEIKEWWSLQESIKEDKKKLITDELEVENNLLKLLRDSIKLQSQADVPIGAFLSGGVDSSLVCAIMQEQKLKKIKTFTIGFENKLFDESNYAKDVSNHLKTEHYEHIISINEVRNIIPKLSSIYDEPFADSSQIPTYLVSKITKEQVSVSLSGDGADELFGGYDRYSTWLKKINLIESIPYSIRSFAALSINLATTIIPNNYSKKKLKRISNILSEKYIKDNYFNQPLSQWGRDCQMLKEIQNSKFKNFFLNEADSSAAQLMYTDLKTYLVDDILCKVDRASMASSLESRAPFLDQRIVDFSSRVPLKMKIKNNTNKYILKKMLQKYLPKNLIYRDKKGFSIPLQEWLKGPLREWSNDLLNPTRIKKQGLINSDLFNNEWTGFVNNKNESTSQIWSLLMLQSWMEDNR